MGVGVGVGLLPECGNTLGDARFHTRGGVFVDGAVLGCLVDGLLDTGEGFGRILGLRGDELADGLHFGFHRALAAGIKKVPTLRDALCLLCRTRLGHRWSDITQYGAQMQWSVAAEEARGIIRR